MISLGMPAPEVTASDSSPRSRHTSGCMSVQAACLMLLALISSSLAGTHPKRYTLQQKWQ